MASNEARAYFTLAGYHFDPRHVTEQLGIEPTAFDDSGTRGDLSKPVLSSWELSTETFKDDFDVYKIIDDLIKQIEPVKDKIAELCKNMNLSPRIELILVLSVDKDEDVPDVGFGARTIKFLSEIGAFINIDYRLSERI